MERPAPRTEEELATPTHKGCWKITIDGRQYTWDEYERRRRLSNMAGAMMAAYAEDRPVALKKGGKKP